MYIQSIWLSSKDTQLISLLTQVPGAVIPQGSAGQDPPVGWDPFLGGSWSWHADSRQGSPLELSPVETEMEKHMGIYSQVVKGALVYFEGQGWVECNPIWMVLIQGTRTPTNSWEGRPRKADMENCTEHCGKQSWATHEHLHVSRWPCLSSCQRPGEGHHHGPEGGAQQMLQTPEQRLPSSTYTMVKSIKAKALRGW